MVFFVRRSLGGCYSRGNASLVVSLVNRSRFHIAANRFPIKHIWDSLALAQVLSRGNVVTRQSLTPRQRFDCLKFYFSANGQSRLLVATPRSANRWTHLGIALAFDLANGGDGEYQFENGHFYPTKGLTAHRLDWRIPTGEAEVMYHRPNRPSMGEILYYVSHNAYFQIRSACLKKMKIVVVTRSIFDIMESRYLKFVAAGNEDGFDWESMLNRLIEFYNSWGDVMRWHPQIRHYRFEDLKVDPVNNFKDMLSFWGYEVPEDCLAEGFRRASRQEMIKKGGAQETGGSKHVSGRSKDQRGILSEARKAWIVDRLKQELIHDFGYEFDYDTKYGILYD